MIGRVELLAMKCVAIYFDTSLPAAAGYRVALRKLENYTRPTMIDEPSSTAQLISFDSWDQVRFRPANSDFLTMLSRREGT